MNGNAQKAVIGFGLAVFGLLRVDDSHDAHFHEAADVGRRVHQRPVCPRGSRHPRPSVASTKPKSNRKHHHFRQQPAKHRRVRNPDHKVKLVAAALRRIGDSSANAFVGVEPEAGLTWPSYASQLRGSTAFWHSRRGSIRSRGEPVIRPRKNWIVTRRAMVALKIEDGTRRSEWSVDQRESASDPESRGLLGMSRFKATGLAMERDFPQSGELPSPTLTWPHQCDD